MEPPRGPRGRLPRLIEKTAIAVFLLLTAPLIAGLLTTIIAAIWFMMFIDAPLEQAAEHGPWFLLVAAAIYGTLCWLVLKPDE